MKIIMWENDAFKKCHPSVVADLKMMIDAREKGLRTVMHWNEIKHCHVTRAYRTIWSLSEASMNEYYKNDIPIGNEQPTTNFLKEILTGIQNAIS